MKNIKVLICDDDENHLDILGDLLQLEGYIVIKENDSMKLIEQITNTAPDIILLDIRMPVISGDEIIKIIRGDDKLKYLPVVAFSASRDIARIAIQAGADNYFTKPFNISEINDLIREIIS